MLKIAICDDDIKYLNLAQTMTSAYFAEHDYMVHVSTFTSSSALMDCIENGDNHDMYLLDIYMPGLSGMSLAAELRKRDISSPVIFLTTSKDHALEAFGVNATQYLVKPYNEKAFTDAIDQALRSLPSSHNKHIVFKTEGEYINISVTKIVCSETKGHYQEILLSSGETVTVRQTSSELFSNLRVHNCFYQCGKSYIVSLAKISKITSESVVMSNGYEIFVPKAALPGLRTAYFDYFEKIW